MDPSQPPITCSFCGRTKDDVRYIIEGRNATICVVCLNESNEKIRRQSSRHSSYTQPRSFPSPKQIHKALNDYIIEQDHAKKILSVAIYSHYHRLHHNQQGSILRKDSVELDKSNILLIGKSGTGKTLLASTLARIVRVPFAIADATTLTEAGYVGDDVENILLRLIQNADFDVGRAEKGIVFIDEIDKISRKSENPSITRDVSGEGVQQALLKIIEGTTASVPTRGGRRHPHGQNITINTKDILFICGGAFVGLEGIVKNRLQSSTIGFQSRQSSRTDDDTLSQTITEDLIKYGLIPEIVGRLPVIATLNPLNKASMKLILTEPKNALLKQYSALLHSMGIPLEVDKTALSYVVDEAHKIGTGARALRNIMETLMTDIIYQAPDKLGHKVLLSKQTIRTKDFFVPLPKPEIEPNSEFQKEARQPKALQNTGKSA